MFDEFYQLHPIKRGKLKAQKIFDKLKEPDKLEAIEGLKRELWYRAKMGAAGEFVPQWKYPQGWINGRRWEDDLAIEEESKAYVDPVAQKLEELKEAEKCGGRLFIGDSEVEYMAGEFVNKEDPSKKLRAYGYIKSGGVVALTDQ